MLSPEELVNKIFYRCDVRYRGRNPNLVNVHTALAKWYLIQHGYHISQEEVDELFKKLNIKPFKCDRYPLRVRREFYLRPF